MTHRSKTLLPIALLLTAALGVTARQADAAAITGDEPGSSASSTSERCNGWEGDPTYWRVENGALVGEVTPATLLKRNSFIVWRGGETRDFELKLEFRVSAQGNSGVNYRSVEVARQRRGR